MVPASCAALCLWKPIEIGIDVGPAEDRAGNDVGGDGGVGRAVAAIAERDPAPRHVRDRTDDRQAGRGFAEGTGPGEYDGGVELRQQAVQLAPERFGLA